MSKKSETIMLANPYNPENLHFPVVVSEKLDGVAADFYGVKMNQVSVRTRQDKPIKSVQHIITWLQGKISAKQHIICELYIPGAPFSEISGKVRQHDAAEDLIAFVYDFYIEGQEDKTYAERMTAFADSTLGEEMFNNREAPVRFIPALHIEKQERLDIFRKTFTKSKPNAEGFVVRSLNGKHSTYKFGRSWGMQKVKNVETLDLKVTGFEEAVSKDGEPKGMVGRIHVSYKDKMIGAGAGKLSHPERIEIWKNKKKYIGKVAEIAYMPDADYDALREPRFLRWRDDK